jgi:integrase
MDPHPPGASTRSRLPGKVSQRNVAQAARCPCLLERIHPHMLRATLIMAAGFHAAVPFREVQLTARHADPRTTTAP